MELQPIDAAEGKIAATQVHAYLRQMILTGPFLPERCSPRYNLRK